MNIFALAEFRIAAALLAASHLVERLLPLVSDRANRRAVRLAKARCKQQSM